MSVNWADSSVARRIRRRRSRARCLPPILRVHARTPLFFPLFLYLSLSLSLSVSKTSPSLIQKLHSNRACVHARTCACTKQTSARASTPSRDLWPRRMINHPKAPTRVYSHTHTQFRVLRASVFDKIDSPAHRLRGLGVVKIIRTRPSGIRALIHIGVC